jgi:hypothetical protein
MKRPNIPTELKTGSVVRHELGRDERTVEIDYFDEKDGWPTFGGPVVDSTENPEHIPERGWSYIHTITEVIEQ